VRLAPISVQNVVTYNVVISVANTDLKLKPGMTANVEIVTDFRQNVLKVPNEALRIKMPAGGKSPGKTGNSSNGQAVWVLEKNGPARIPVTTGITDGEYTEITSGGVSEGQKVVIEILAASGDAKRMPRGPGMF